LLWVNGDSQEDALALAAALRDGAFPSRPAITTIGFGFPHSNPQKPLEAMGAILAATPAVTELGFNVMRHTQPGLMAPVLQTVCPHQGPFQQLR
jgi:hypothetical protein